MSKRVTKPQLTEEEESIQAAGFTVVGFSFCKRVIAYRKKPTLILVYPTKVGATALTERWVACNAKTSSGADPEKGK